MEHEVITKLEHPYHSINTIYSYTYDNTEDVLRVLENNEKRPDTGYHTDVYGGNFSPSFAGVATTEKFIDLLNFGVKDKKSIKEFDDALANVNLDNCKLERIRGNRYTVAGGCVSVPRFLAGNPACMMQSRRVKAKSPVFHIVLNTVVNCSVTKGEVAKVGMVIARVIAEPMALGYKVRFSASNITPQERRVTAMNVCIKREDEPLNIQRFLMPIMEVCFSRGLEFSWAMRHPTAFEPYEDGYSLNSRYPLEFRKEVFKTITGVNDPVVLNLPHLVDLLRRHGEEAVERFVRAQIEEPDSRIY